MDKILLQFFDICRLKIGPQDLPASKLLMWFVLLAYGTLALLLTVEEKGLAVAIQVGIVDTLLLSGLTYIVVWVRDFPERYVQVLSAMAGCSVLLALMLWPLLAMQQYGASGGGNFFIVVATLLLWVWLLWQVAIIGNIFKHALDTSIWMSLIIACFYLFLSYRVMRTLFFSPEVTTAVPVT